MGRPKGFVPAACPECANKGKHKTTCSRSGKKREAPAITRRKMAATSIEHVRPYTRHEETEEEKVAVVEGGLPAIHTYTSLRQDYKCTANIGGRKCGELLEMGRQHWTTGHDDHLCMEHAADYERRRVA